MNLAFKPDTKKLKDIQNNRPPVMVEVDGDPNSNRRGKYKRWSDKELEVIEELLVLGVSHSTLARMLNSGVVALQRAIHNRGINRHAKKKRKELIQQVMDKLNDE